MKEVHFKLYYSEPEHGYGLHYCLYSLQGLNDGDGNFSMQLPSRHFWGRDIDEVVVIPKEYYDTIKDSEHTTNINKCPKNIDVRSEAEALEREIVYAPYKNGYSADVINHIVRLVQNRQIDAIRVIDYAARQLNMTSPMFISVFCYCIMHIDDNELAEYYLKYIVEEAAGIHGSDKIWDCVFMVCEKWRSAWCLKLLNECKEQYRFDTIEALKYADKLIDKLGEELNCKTNK